MVDKLGQVVDMCVNEMTTCALLRLQSCEHCELEAVVKRH